MIATGDTNQLESIDLITNQHDYDEYYNRCIDLVFPNNIYLRESKRLKDPRQRETQEFQRRHLQRDDPSAENAEEIFQNRERKQHNLQHRIYEQDLC